MEPHLKDDDGVGAETGFVILLLSKICTMESHCITAKSSPGASGLKLMCEMGDDRIALTALMGGGTFRCLKGVNSTAAGMK